MTADDVGVRVLGGLLTDGAQPGVARVIELRGWMPDYAPRTQKPQVSMLTCGFLDLRARRDSNPKPSDP